MNTTPTSNANHAAPHRTFTEAITICFIKFANFKGRASRSEFWWFWLFSYVLIELATISGIVTGDTVNVKFFWGIEWPDESLEALLIGTIFLLPTIAVGARRLHDIGRSGWWQLLTLTGIGFFILLYWWLQPGNADINEFYDER